MCLMPRQGAAGRLASANTRPSQDLTDIAFLEMGQRSIPRCRADAQTTAGSSPKLQSGGRTRNRERRARRDPLRSVLSTCRDRANRRGHGGQRTERGRNACRTRYRLCVLSGSMPDSGKAESLDLPPDSCLNGACIQAHLPLRQDERAAEDDHCGLHARTAQDVP
jgi:hypothetical protein